MVANPNNNHGFIFKLGSVKSEFLYKSTESSDLTLSPKLTVTYTGQTNIVSHRPESPMVDFFINTQQQAIHLSLVDQQDFKPIIYTLQGKPVIAQLHQNNSEFIIPLNHLASGMYVLKLYVNDRKLQISQKFFLE